MNAPVKADPAYDASLSEHSWQVPKYYNMATDVADRHPREKRALIFESADGHVEEVSWGQVQDRSKQIAAHLQSLGVLPGDRVAVLLPQRPDTPATYLGVLRTGAIMVTMSLLWADEPIAFRLQDSGAKIIVTEEATLDRVRDFRGVVVNVDDPNLDAIAPLYDEVLTRAEDPALIFYTSGTTGTAKGVVHAHRTLLGHNEFQACHDLRDGDVFYGAGDWAWSLAKLMGPLRLGVTHLVYRPAKGLDPEGLLRAMSRHGVTTALVNPTFLRKLREHEPEAGRRFPQKFRVVCSSNEPLTVDLIQWFRNQFGISLLDYYGSTESYPLLGNFANVQVREGSIGHPLPGWEVALLDENEQEVKQGEPGEICLRSRSNPQFPLGYWQQEEASREAFGGDWYHTKDQATMDADGYYWFLARTDDVIKSSGYRIGPYEVEEALRKHPAVHDAGVVGVPDVVRGQAVKAWIELAAGFVASPELATELREFAKQNFSRFAYPQIIVFINELPRSATGKIIRAELRAAD